MSKAFFKSYNAFGLTEEERKEVYWAVVAELVKNRLERARSV